ncbi:MAG: hypothetical protein LBD71_06620 [Treponema sp.]|jgi:hypothetical protein|nr:hypothetical protein [Treponema sp.]
MKRLSILIFAGFILSGLGAQNNRPVIKLMPFSMTGIGADEGRLLDSLIRSYLSDFGEVISFFPNKDGLFMTGEDIFAEDNSLESWTQIPNYTVSGSLRMEEDGRILSMDVGDMATGEVRSYSYSYKSAGELALKARSILENAFITPPERRQEPVHAEIINENRIMGSWKGEEGIEMVRLYRGGRGMAIFSSGAQMALSYTVESNTLIVRQVSPNSERYYYPLPYERARSLSAAAAPMVWELRLFRRGSVLRGLKSTAGFSADGNEIVPEIKDVEWARGPAR